MELQDFLHEKQSNSSNLVKKVISTILQEEKENQKNYMENVINYGCISGAVSSLIYYADTTKFYNQHEREIWDLAKEYEYDYMNTSDDLDIVKNNASWFAFELITMQLLDEYISEYEIIA